MGVQISVVKHMLEIHDYSTSVNRCCLWQILISSEYNLSNGNDIVYVIVCR